MASKNTGKERATWRPPLLDEKGASPVGAPFCAVGSVHPERRFLIGKTPNAVGHLQQLFGRRQDRFGFARNASAELIETPFEKVIVAWNPLPLGVAVNRYPCRCSRMDHRSLGLENPTVKIKIMSVYPLIA